MFALHHLHSDLQFSYQGSSLSGVLHRALSRLFGPSQACTWFALLSFLGLLPHLLELFLELLSKGFFFRRRFLLSNCLEILTLSLKLFQRTNLWIRRIIVFWNRLGRSWNNRHRSTRSIRPSSRRWSRRRARRRWQRYCFWFSRAAGCSYIESRRDHCHLSQRILATEIENVGSG